MTSSLIAIIDNDQAFRTTMARALEEEGYTLLTAAWHPDTLKSLPGARPQLILLNIHAGAMPDWSVTEELQADLVTQGTPILVCCADPKQSQRAMVALLRHGGLVGESSYNMEEVTLKAQQLLDLTAVRGNSAAWARSVGE